ncbi:radical SAM protein [Chitinophagaceae bacterium LB-8]|uniref:Radical SAM protein n=1 Tax=Paraflavisolibacter caeni TaxID=2982496 RepID=A0A9X3B7X1_9BACT|nr:radical SAM protein [Paraflavisolibacter caeni]MCU7548976.1 radical SAM protein [Paraflavisolibacter caeni]
MLQQSLLHTYKRYRTLHTNDIKALPIVILMPHSACNCRCIMCDIWKSNLHLRQLKESDIRDLIATLKKLETRQVVMSGGEALLNPDFFLFCEMLRKENLHITLLTTGLSLSKHAASLLQLVNDIIVSLDGDEQTHDTIRNIKGAYQKMSEGVQYLKAINPSYRISARTVIHRLNYKVWKRIIKSAKEIGLNQISFLPADVSSHAFNRPILWNDDRQLEIALHEEELPELMQIIDELLSECQNDFLQHFIAESPEKIKKIYNFYSALYNKCDFPYKKCNAPWVSTVVEADGVVKPCFFHSEIGNIHNNSLIDILNGQRAKQFRKNLNVEKDETCKRCVCSLNLPAWLNPVVTTKN